MMKKAVILTLGLVSLCGCECSWGDDYDDPIALKLMAHDKDMRQLAYEMENAAIPHMNLR